MAHFFNQRYLQLHRYLGVIEKSYQQLRKNLLLLAPDLVLLFTTLILSIVFLWFNGLLPGAFQDPSVLFQTQEGVSTLKDILIKFLGKTEFLTFLISLLAFFVARFFIGAGLLTIKYNMIKRVLEGKKVKNFKEEYLAVLLNPGKFINIIKMNVIIYFLMLFFAFFLTLITLLFFEPNTFGFLMMVFLTSLSVFAIKLLFFFRYAVLFLDNESAWNAIKKSFYYFKKHPLFVFLVWLFLFIAIAIIGFILSVLIFGVSKLVFLVVGTIVSLFILNLLQSISDVFINLLGDIFVFNVYSKKKI